MLEPVDSPDLHKGRSLHGQYSRNCSFHTKESLLGILLLYCLGFAKQPHGHQRKNRTREEATVCI